MTTLQERIRDILEEVYQSRRGCQAALARVAGVSRGLITQILENPSQTLGYEYAKNIERELGYRVEWILEGKGPKKIGGGIKVEPVLDDEENPELFRVRKVKLRLSAGIAGFSVDAIEEDANPIYFRKDWFSQRGYNPIKLIAIKVKGESMEPSLYADDTVVINTADTTPIDGEVFAVNYEGEDVIKRLVRDAGTWWLTSDNPDNRRFPRKECGADACIIIGRVVHKQSERI